MTQHCPHTRVAADPREQNIWIPLPRSAGAPGPVRGLGPLVPHDAPRLAKLLRAGYLDARYSLGFEVSREDLETLAGYVQVFRARATRVCREQLAVVATAS